MTLSLPAFAARHIGPREDDLDAMLQVVGAASLEALAAAAIPDDIRAAAALDIEPAASEAAVLDQLRSYADKSSKRTP